MSCQPPFEARLVDGKIYGRGTSYDVYVNGNATKVADMPGSNAWVDLGTYEKINEIQWAGTTYNTADGLGSAGVYVNAIMVNGVLLRDNMSEFGTNGFWLDFRDNTSTTTLGYDYSGRGNHFTPDEVSVSGWEGNDSVETTLSITLSSTLTLQALFEEIKTYTLTVSSVLGGSVS